MMPDAPLLAATGLKKCFVLRKRLFGAPEIFAAVKGVDLAVARGQTLALVGESGSGKSTVGRMLIGLLTPDAGSVVYDGTDIAPLDARALKPLRRQLQIVFQDPQLSLNPRRSIAANIARPLNNFGITGSAAVDRVAQLLRQVGLDPAYGRRAVNEISGGQCQRVAIARALALDPKFLVLDEPVSALDVSVQAQILNLLLDLQDSLGLAYVLITHDLRLVPMMARHMAVMRDGLIVERGESAAILADPTDAYTSQLVRGVLKIGTTPDWDSLVSPSPQPVPQGTKLETQREAP